MMWSPKDSILPPERNAVFFLFQVGRDLRRHGSSFPPMFIWQNTKDEVGMAQLFYPVGELAGAVDEVLIKLSEDQESDVVWFSIVIDAYGRTIYPNDMISTDIESMGDMFSAGDPGIVEQLMAVIAYDGDVRSWRQIYRYSAQDEWEWDEPEWMQRSVISDGPLQGVMELHAQITAVHETPQG